MFSGLVALLHTCNGASACASVLLGNHGTRWVGVLTILEDGEDAWRLHSTHLQTQQLASIASHGNFGRLRRTTHLVIDFQMFQPPNRIRIQGQKSGLLRPRKLGPFGAERWSKNNVEFILIPWWDTNMKDVERWYNDGIWLSHAHFFLGCTFWLEHTDNHFRKSRNENAKVAWGAALPFPLQ